MATPEEQVVRLKQSLSRANDDLFQASIASMSNRIAHLVRSAGTAGAPDSQTGTSLHAVLASQVLQAAKPKNAIDPLEHFKKDIAALHQKVKEATALQQHCTAHAYSTEPHIISP